MRLLNKMENFLFPLKAVCLGCGDRTGMQEEWLCPACRRRLFPKLHEARPTAKHLDGAYFCVYYEKPASRLVLNLKFGGVWRVADFMADLMEKPIEHLPLSEFDCIVPVPLHPARFRERGYNQAGKLAEALAKKTGLPVSEGLIRVKMTKRQAKLSISGRAGNVSDAFAIKLSYEGRRVLLVDDVITTGSTLNACAAALKATGALSVTALTFAGSRYYRWNRTHRHATYRKV